MSRATTILVAAMLCLAMVSASAPAAAQESSSGIFEIDVADNQGGMLDAISSLVSGLGVRGLDSVGSYVDDFRDNEPTPTEQTDKLRTYLNERNQTFINHTNRVLDDRNASVANTTYVLELTVENEERDGTDSSTVYVVATADGSNITSGKVVNSTTKEVDKSRTMSWNKAKMLNQDVRHYYQTYANPGELPPDSYFVEIASKYGSVSEIQVNS